MNQRSRKFLSYYRPYLAWLFVDVLCAFVVSAVALLLPLCVGYITRDILENGNPHALEQISLMGGVMVLLVIIHTLGMIFIDYQGHMMGAHMESDMRRELFDHLQKLSFRFYDQQKTGQLMSRITNDIFWLSELYHHGPEDIAISLAKFAGAFLILASINLQLTLIIFLFLPFVAAYALYFNRYMNRALSNSKARIGDINAQVEDTLAGIRVVQSFSNEGLEKAKFAYANQRFVESRRAGYRSEAYFYSGMIAATHLITIAVVSLGGIAIMRAALDLADLLVYLLCVGILIEPIQKMANFARLYQEGITGFNRFMELLEVAPDIQDSPDASPISQVRGHIEFRQVSFRYQDDHRDTLQQVSLDIPAGQFPALVGPSGVGKSTLCSLIPRFYEVSAGEILLDGRDIRGICLASLRSHIGIVQQDVYLFSGTVADNIRYGRLEASQADVVEAARKAHAHDFIMALPQGYDTDIGQRGVKLSGGQKQRLSIARVFLRNPPIIIFDEATSALDNESERAVQASLELLSSSRTTLVIAHRLSTVQNAQRIVVLSEQGIVEQGTHTELIATDGIYARLYHTQLRA